MELIGEEDLWRQEKTWTLRIPLSEYTRIKLTGHDRAVIYECEHSKKVSDKLLALDLIARKIEEL